ncbi:MAG: carbohydrate kinase family protein [Candidatus Levybacteria bacterium]|nr:carbohydrate kinase family protein [Candidatus Levybacteria bacterium]
MRTTVLTLGNALIDLFLQIHHEEDVVSYDTASNRISLPQGAKILLDSCDAHVGGNAANVAVGLKRLGIESGIMAEIAKDEFSQKISNDLKNEGVQTEHVLFSDGQTSISIALNFHQDRTLFTTHQKHEHNFNFDFETDWVYLTSLGESWRHVYEKIGALAQEKKIHLAFNPGSVQLASGVASFSHILPYVDLLFVNKEEAISIVGEHERELDLVRSLLHKGVKIPVVTDGERGAYSVDEAGKFFHLDSKKATVVERTGAGDAFASGLLAAHILKKPIREAMEWGMYNSVGAIGSVGAQTGLLHRERMEAQVK